MTNIPYRPSGSPAYGYPGYPPQTGGYPQYPMQSHSQPQPQPQMQTPQAPTAAFPPGGTVSQLPIEQSFIENILRLNLGKTGTFYMTYENNSEWNAKIFKGRIEAAGRDHIIISDPNTGMRYLLLMVNLDYVTFDEELKYSYPYGGQPTPR